jgi:hypothetical protein
VVRARRDQNDSNRGPGNGPGAVRPCANDPEQLSSALVFLDALQKYFRGEFDPATMARL